MEEAMMGDASLGDQSMLDANMADTNIDDLFGEGPLASHALESLHSTPPPSRVALRVAELQSRGCCTKLAWTQNANIAEITKDGLKVAFRSLIRSQKDGTWSVTKESNSPILAPPGRTWEHIQFSTHGIDLAAIDSYGMVHMFTMNGPLGRMNAVPSQGVANELSGGDLDAVVGLHWLSVAPVDFRIPYIGPANKTDGQWEMGPSAVRDPADPKVYHPTNGRSALFYVTRNAKLIVKYQSDNQWHSARTDLEQINSSEQVISHAALAEDGDGLLVVTHDISRRFRLYKVKIDWFGTVISVNRQLDPKLSLRHLRVQDNVAAQYAPNVKLSHLLLVAPIIRLNKPTDLDVHTFPTILAVFSQTSLPTDQTQPFQISTVIARWYVESVTPTLHEAFSKLNTANGTTPAVKTQVTRLRRQEDIITSKVIDSVQLWNMNAMLLFVASDETVEFRERATMEIIEPSSDDTVAHSWPRSGFGYDNMMGEHSDRVAITTDGSGLLSMKNNGRLEHKTIPLRYGWETLDDGMTATYSEAAVMCVARQHVLLCFMGAASDGPLATLPADLSLELRSFFMKQNILMSRRMIDTSMQDVHKQQAYTMQEPLLPRLLSAQLVVGCKPGTTEWNYAGKFAFTFLNLKHVLFPLVQLLNNPNAYSRPDNLVSMRGLMKWTTDMFAYIAVRLVEVKRKEETTGNPPAKQLFEAYVAETDIPIVNILLSASTRCLLRMLAGCLPKYCVAVKQQIQNASNIIEKHELNGFLEMVSSLPFKFADVDNFLSDFDGAVRNHFINLEHLRRQDIELAAFCDTGIPEEAEPVFQALLDTILPKLMSKMDLGKLHFWDTDWLGVTPALQTREYDIIRKLPLRKGAKARVCRRCGAKMEDMLPPALRHAPHWVQTSHRYCVCTNYWVLDEDAAIGDEG